MFRAVGAVVVTAFVRRIIVVVGVVLILIRYLSELLELRFLFQGFNFTVERSFKLARRTAEFGHGLPDRPPQLRQLFGAEEEQRQEEDENRLLPAQRTHRLFPPVWILLTHHNRGAANWGGPPAGRGAPATESLRSLSESQRPVGVARRERRP